MTTYRLVLPSLLVIAAAAACGGDDDGGDDTAPDAGVALFPADYADTYTEVRDCPAYVDVRLHHF